MANSSRREFFKIAAISGVSLLALSSVAQAEKRRAAKPAAGGATGDAALPWVKPGEGMAASVNYQEKHSAVKDAALKVDRQGVKFADQKCTGCMLYTSIGKKDGVEAGKCTLFANQLVKGEGWCSSWSKKA
jgi:hypothetical protein